MTKKEQGKKLGQIIKRAWEDELFKRRLLDDANAVFKDEGLVVPDGIKVKVVENTEKIYHIVIPANCPDNILLDEALSQISAGGIWVTPCGNRDACDPRPGLAQ